MISLIRTLLNAKRVRQLSREWQEYYDEFQYIHALWVAALHASTMFANQYRFAMHREMLRRADGRERYCRMLLRKMQENTAELQALTHA